MPPLKNTEAAKEAYPLRSIVEANIGDVGRFAEVLNSMPAVRQKRVYATLPAIFGEDWPQKALELLMQAAPAPGKSPPLIEEGQDKVLVKHLKHELLRQTLPAESSSGYAASGMTLPSLFWPPCGHCDAFPD